MNEDLKKLEEERKNLYQRLSKIGDMRRGAISANYRRCGKHPCCCERPEHPGHGPQYLYTKKVKGKTVSKLLKLGPEFEKYKREIENRKKFQHLCGQIMDVNEKICNLRPLPKDMVGDEQGEVKKKLHRRYSRRRGEK